MCFRLIPEEVLQSNRVSECLRPLDKKLGLALVVKKMDDLNCRHPIFRNKQLSSKIYRSSFYMKPELGWKPKDGLQFWEMGIGINWGVNQRVSKSILGRRPAVSKRKLKANVSAVFSISICGWECWIRTGRWYLSLSSYWVNVDRLICVSGWWYSSRRSDDEGVTSHRIFWFSERRGNSVRPFRCFYLQRNLKNISYTLLILLW